MPRRSRLAAAHQNRESHSTFPPSSSQPVGGSMPCIICNLFATVLPCSQIVHCTVVHMWFELSSKEVLPFSIVSAPQTRFDMSHITGTLYGMHIYSIYT